MYKRVHAKKAYNKGKKILLVLVILLLTTSVGYSALQRTITLNVTSTAKSDFRYDLSCETGTEILGKYQDEYLWFYEGVYGTNYKDDGCGAYSDGTGYAGVSLLTQDDYGDNGRYITFTIKNISDGTIKVKAIDMEGPGNFPYLGKVNTTSSNIRYYNKTNYSLYKTYYYGTSEYDSISNGIMGWDIYQIVHVIREYTNGTMDDITYDDASIITDASGVEYYKIAPGEKIHYAVYNGWSNYGLSSSTYYVRIDTYLDFNISKY